MTDTINSFGPEAGIGADKTLYLAPASPALGVLVTLIHVADTSGGQLGFAMAICATNGTAIAAANTIYPTGFPVAGPGVFEARGYWLKPGQALRWNAPAGLTAYGTVVETTSP